MNVYEDELLEHDSFQTMYAYIHRDSYNDKNMIALTGVKPK